MVVYVRIVDGRIASGMRIRMMNNRSEFVVDEVGVFAPAMAPVDELLCGEVGYFIASIKNVRDSKVGDTVTDAAHPTTHPLPGYRAVTPMVFAGIFPVDRDDVTDLKEALQRLNLNDASLVFEPETSAALGFGFRCGFLGLLHMEIVQERLEREFNLSLITTAPTVEYRVRLRTGEVVAIDNPDKLPDAVDGRGHRGAAHQGDDHRAEHLCRGDHGAVPGAPRRVPAHGVPTRRSGRAHLRPAARRRSSTTSTTSSSRAAGATPRSTTRWPGSAPRTW